ncbi:MAG: hypothetical protein H6577_25220 [Lewinellaceae bacterium]|nr:hypothetical protein [Saprospiraceae bacterium]MCB9341438.1 hypothetical protein [Lewinellaceae bacterium]
MLIANPIYDTVFKYMMDDNKVARIFLSAIIGEEIVELELRPTERAYGLDTPSIAVYRLDFAAKIKARSGELKLVLIEIQKAKYPSDIMRFRRYLGYQYADDNNTAKVVMDSGGERYITLPILTIYFLGHKLEHTDAPVIKVNRQCIDVVSGKPLEEKEEFIESLTHDSFIIQIPALKNKRQTELLVLLSVFDQANRYSGSHILDVNEEDFPEKFRPIVRRLQMAGSERKIRDTMIGEDDILEGLRMQERTIARQQKILADNQKEIEGKEKEIEEKEKEIERLRKLLEGK